MTKIVRFQPRTTQPDQVQVAFGNPLCSGLVYAAIPGGLRWVDGTYNQRSTLVAGTPTGKNWQIGRAISFDGSTYYTANRRNNYILTTATPHTLFVLCYSTASAVQNPFSLGMIADSNFRTGFEVDTASGVLSWINGSADVASTISTAQNTLLSCAIVNRAANARSFMVNKTITTNTTNFASQSCASGISIGVAYTNSSPDTTSAFTGYIYMVAAWARALQNTELKALYANPWQVFSSPGHYPFVQPAAGVATFKPYFVQQRSQVIGGGLGF